MREYIWVALEPAFPLACNINIVGQKAQIMFEPRAFCRSGEKRAPKHFWKCTSERLHCRPTLLPLV